MSTHTEHRNGKSRGAASGAPTPGAHRHEKTDISAGFAAVSAGGLVGLMFIGMALMFGLFAFLQSQWTRQDTPPSPLAAQLPARPPAPELQVKPANELQRLRERERKLHEYGWVEPAAGVAHVPIERAIELTLERGLPVRGEAKARDKEVKK